MALVKCPECGNEISETAKSCPKCGVKKPGDVLKWKNTDPATKTIVTILAVFFIVCILITVAVFC